LIIAIGLSIIAIFQLIRKLFGGSWSVEIVVLTLVSINLTGTVYLARETGVVKTEMKYLRRDTNELRRDMHALGQDMHRLHEQVARIDQRLRGSWSR